MIDRAATEQLIISKVAMITKKDPASITRDTRLQADLDMKSIDYVGLSATLENELGEAPNFKDMLSMEKISDISDFIIDLKERNGG